MRAVLRLMQLRCWVVPGRDSSSSASSVRRVPSLHSAVSLRLVNTWPLFLQALRHFCSAGGPRVRSASLRSVLGKNAAKPSGRPGSGPAARWRRQSPDKPALDCAGSRSASASVRCTLIPGTMPVREERRTPHPRFPALTPLGRPGPGRGGRLPTAQCRSLSGSGSLRSPSPCAAKAHHPSRSRPPPRPRSTAFRALGHLETQRLVPASRPVPISTSSPAPPSSL